MDMVFEYLNMTRVYTKPKGQMPDYSAPVILRGVAEPTVEQIMQQTFRAHAILTLMHAFYALRVYYT